MNRLAALILLALLTAFAASAQMDFSRVPRQKPDFNEIKRQVNDRRSPYYYPRLMEEFQRPDSLMKLDKYRYLYLGYALQEDYNPYRKSVYANRTAPQGDRKKLTPQECDTIIKYAKLILLDNPLDLLQMKNLIDALRQKGNTNLADIWEYKYNYILMAIVSTGTGEDEDNAWYVVETQHEYVLLNSMGLTVTDHVFYSPYYEYIKVVDAKGSPLNGYYFNIHHILEEHYRKNPDDL